MPPEHRSIGEVLAELREDFPDVTISKIRFLEGQGLIDPERTPSGYRKFYDGDVERLRWILHQQKEHFLPLKVIKERLEQLEEGEVPVVAPAPAEPPEPLPHEGAPVASRTRPPAPTLPLDDGRGDDLVPDATGVSLTRAELARAAGVGEESLMELQSYGLLAPSSESGEGVLFDEEGLAIARLAAGFSRHGIEPRHLRMYRSFAEREVGLFQQVLLPYLRQRNPEARAKAQDELAELARLGRGLRTAFLRQAVREALGE